MSDLRKLAVDYLAFLGPQDVPDLERLVALLRLVRAEALEEAAGVAVEIQVAPSRPFAQSSQAYYCFASGARTAAHAIRELAAKERA